VNDRFDFDATRLAYPADAQVWSGATVDNLSESLVWLKTMGFSYVQVEYIGGDGRGQFLPARCYRALRADHWSAVGLRSAQLIGIFKTLLDSRYPDWRKSDGSAGDFRCDVDANALIHTHYFRGATTDRLTIHGV
jgi:hypothetical protein